MTELTTPPFSNRVRGPHQQIEGTFPDSARQGLLHILVDLVDKGYVAGWHTVARELQRVGRLDPKEYDNTRTATKLAAREDAAMALASLKWEKVFDFCERLYSRLAEEIGFEGQYGYEVCVDRSTTQGYVATELQLLFQEEGFAYEFSEGVVRRRGRKHTVEVATRAQVVLGAPELNGARRHFTKAQEFFRHPTRPDFENAVK
jgi:hypothetical protein